MKQIITKFGMDLIAHALNGGGIEFCEVLITNATGVDEYGGLTWDSNEEPRELTSTILNEEGGELAGESNSTYVVLPAKFDNSQLEHGFYNTATLIIARKSGDDNPDTNSAAVYAACIIDKADADYIPPKTRHIEIELNYYVFVAGAENITTIISDSFSYVTKEVFNKHTHTAAAVGAAAASHRHSASDINSGVLSVERGGTGANSIDGLRNKIMHFGTFTGNGESERVIDLGTKPKFVFVWCFSDDFAGTSGMAMEDATGAVINQSNAGTTYTEPTSYSYHYTSVAIEDNGFKVSNCSVSGHSSTNVNGYKYGYMYY